MPPSRETDEPNANDETPRPGPALLWFRRDLRLADHPALQAAADSARAADSGMLGVFVLDQRLWDSGGVPRRAFLAGALADLFERTGGRVVVLRGDPVQGVIGAARHIGAASVHVTEEVTPYGRQRDATVRAALAEHDIAWVATGSPYAVTPGRIRKPDGSAYRVFTPFSKAWAAHGWRAPAGPARSVPWLSYDGPDAGGLPDEAVPSGLTLPTPTEAAANATWAAFRDGPLADYRTQRNRPDLAGTSRLSAYLHLGLIHPRTLLADLGDRAAGSEKGPTTFRNELCWREFYADVLHENPASAWETYNPQFADFRWETGESARSAFERWQRGETGFPIVDAGMRQLLAEGWMHNRVRMITASFLVKDLHLPWQWGARHFLDHLVDGDVASNNHGWQWTAGTGTDAAPYFRVFNPVLQGKKYDPDGAYVRRFVPALSDVDVGGGAIHEPWALPTPPKGYPGPMVDHFAERDDALARYEEVRA